MINKSCHNILKGVSILPALLVLPAVADVPTIGFIGDYVSSLSYQLHDIFVNQNTTGFEIGKFYIGTDMSSVEDGGIRYGIDATDVASQYVRIEQFGLPVNTGDLHLEVPLDPGPNMRDRGLNTQKLSIMVLFMGTDIIPDDGSVVYDPDTITATVLSNGHVNVKLDDIMAILPLVGSDVSTSVDPINNVMENGKIEENYLFTGNNFVIDGHYGNMINEIILNYRDSVVEKFEDFNDYLAGNADNSYTPGKVVKGILGFKISDLSGLTAEERASAVDSYLSEVTSVFSNLNSLKLKIGEIEINGGNVSFANNVNLVTSKLDITNGANVLVDEGASVGVILDDISITYNGQYDTEEPVTTTQNYTVHGATISGANTHVTIADNATLTIAGNQLDVTNGASLVNNGTLNIMTQTNNLDEDLTGTGTLVVYENNTVNVGTHNITQDTITLNGTMNATVRGGNSAQFNANTFNGNGNLNLSFATTGTYHVFGNNVFGETGEGDVDLSGINVDSSLYNLDWLNDGKDLKVSLKSADNIAADNELSNEAATTVAGLAGSSSGSLNELGLAIQEKLAEGTPGAIQEVEQAVASINPETESVSKTVSHSIQNTLTDLVNSRMALLSVGRSAGDVNLTSGGVWVHGLYNKTKLNDSFNGYTRGVALGLDGRINHDLTIGAGYSFNNSDVVTRSHDIDIDSNTVFVYGQYKPARWFANGVMNYTWSEYNEKGLSSMAPTTSKYDTGSFGAALSGGYEFDFGLTLGLGARYMNVGEVSYTDSQGIEKKFDSTDYLTAMFGTKYGWNFKASENMLIRPEARYALKYDVLYDATNATVMMPGTAAYTLTGDRLSRIGNEFGLGLMMRYRAMSLSLNYDVEIRKDYTSQTGMARLRYKF